MTTRGAEGLTFRRIAATLLLAIMAACTLSPAFAEQPLPPAAAPLEPGFRLQLATWGEANASGGSEEVTYGGRLAAEGPLANAWRRPLRIYVSLDVGAAPGETFDPSDVGTWARAADVTVGTAYRLARRTVEKQRISTGLYFEGGFTTALEGEVLDRYKRQMGLGLVFAVALDANRSAFLRVGYTRDELQGYIGAGGIRVVGQVPIGDKGVLLGGEALVNLSRATQTQQHDQFRLWAGVDLSRLYGVIAR